MNPLLIISLLAVMDTVVSQCHSGEYESNEGQCCTLPPPGNFITKNCTKSFSMKFKTCSECLGTGMTILANCTLFNDTQCGCEDGYAMLHGNCVQEPISAAPTVSESPSPDHKPHTEILVPAIAVVMTLLIALFAMFAYRLHWSRNKDMFQKVPC
ncbi:hypothetical protein AGOR_G00160690 [Albula goreensis]|uniref:TNFR-Cys domain-containing protein n=1 Tax=Albula goreensis TaxID=1534307 RepID=A0A8T3D698_9TELE|nr:hypothetical protein AGOR_G00160690 [Albula goreensis]